MSKQKYGEIIKKFYETVKDDESILKLFRNACVVIEQALKDERFHRNRKADRIRDFTIAISERIKKQQTD